MKNNNWYNIKDKLPEDGQRVLLVYEVPDSRKNPVIHSSTFYRTLSEKGKFKVDQSAGNYHYRNKYIYLLETNAYIIKWRPLEEVLNES